MMKRMELLCLLGLLLVLLAGCGASGGVKLEKGTISLDAMEQLDSTQDLSLHGGTMVANGNAFYKLTITGSKIPSYDDVVCFLVSEEEAICYGAMSLQEGKSGVYDLYFSVAPEQVPLYFGVKEYTPGTNDSVSHLYDLEKKEWLKEGAYTGPALEGDFRFY